MCVCQQLMLAEKSTDPVSTYISSLVPLLKLTYDDACSRYVELFLEREGCDSLADRLSQQTLLVFLVDDTDVLPLTRSRQHSHDDAGKLHTHSALMSLPSRLFPDSFQKARSQKVPKVILGTSCHRSIAPVFTIDSECMTSY